MGAVLGVWYSPNPLSTHGVRGERFLQPKSLPDGAARREAGQCEGGGVLGIDETDFQSYVSYTNCKKIFGISCINSIHEAVRGEYDNVEVPDEVDYELGV
jgi:hypothetical protein